MSIYSNSPPLGSLADRAAVVLGEVSEGLPPVIDPPAVYAQVHLIGCLACRFCLEGSLHWLRSAALAPPPLRRAAAGLDHAQQINSAHSVRQ